MAALQQRKAQTLELWEVCIVVPSGSQFPAPWALTTSSRTENTRFNQSREKCNQGCLEGPLNRNDEIECCACAIHMFCRPIWTLVLKLSVEKQITKEWNWNQMEREMSIKASGWNMLLCVCLAWFSVVYLWPWAVYFRFNLIVQKQLDGYPASSQSKWSLTSADQKI